MLTAYGHLSIPAAMAGLETCSGDGSGFSAAHTHNLKNLRISKRPNRKAVFRSNGGPPEFCYRSLQRTVSVLQLWASRRHRSDSQLVTEASLTKDSARCKPVFDVIL